MANTVVLMFSKYPEDSKAFVDMETCLAYIKICIMNEFEDGGGSMVDSAKSVFAEYYYNGTFTSSHNPAFLSEFFHWLCSGMSIGDAVEIIEPFDYYAIEEIEYPNF